MSWICVETAIFLHFPNGFGCCETGWEPSEGLLPEDLGQAAFANTPIGSGLARTAPAASRLPLSPLSCQEVFIFLHSFRSLKMDNHHTDVGRFSQPCVFC